MTREYLTTADVSELTGNPVGTLRYWRHRRRGEGPKTSEADKGRAAARKRYGLPDPE